MSIPMNPELWRDVLHFVEANPNLFSEGTTRAVVARCNFEPPTPPVDLYSMPKVEREQYIAERLRM
jgi:hypothetical protein